MARIGRAHPAKAYKPARPVPPVLTSHGTAALTGAGTLSANASSAGVHNGIAVLAGAGTAGAKATQVVRPAAMAGHGTVAASGGGNASAHLTGAGTLTPPKVVQRTSPALAGAGTFSAKVIQRGAASLTGAGTLGPRAVQRSAAHLTAASTLAATGSSRVTVHLAGAGTLGAAATTGVAKITRLGSAAQGTAGATTVMTVPKIAGTAQGQIILIWCAAGFAGMTWSSSGFSAEPAASGTSGSAQLLWRIADGTEGSAFTVTSSTGHSWAAIIATYFNENIQSPFDGTPSSGQINLSSKSVSAASISTTEANDELIWFGFVQASPGNVPQVITAPGGFTPEVTQANSGGTGTSTVGVLMADSLQTGLGATGVISGSVPANAVSGATLIAISTVSTTLTAAGTLTATGGVTLRTALHGAGTLTPKARLSAPSHLTGAGTFSARGVIRGTATLTGAGTFHAGATLGGVFLRGAGTLRAAQSVGGHVPLAGAGVMNATGKVPQVAALHGAGAMSATGKLKFGVAMNGAGAMSAKARVSATAHLTGASTLAPLILGQVHAVLAGAGTMSATSRKAGRASLAGQGTVTAQARILGHAALHGTSVFAPKGGLRGRAVLTAASAASTGGRIRGASPLAGHATLTPHPTALSFRRLTGSAPGPTASEAAMSTAVNSFVSTSGRPLQVFRAYAGTTSAGVLTITTTTVPNGTKGTAYGPFSLAAANGSGKLTWSESSADGTGTGPLVGATVNKGHWPTTVTTLGAAQAYDTIIGRDLAGNVQKCYSQSADPTDVESTMSQLTASFGINNMSFLIGVIPSKSNTTADFNTLRAGVKTLIAAGYTFAVTIQQEPNAGSKFASPAAYRTYMKFYAPAVRLDSSGNPTGIQVVYDPSLVVGGGSSAVDFYPGDDVTDAFYVDYYATAHKSTTMANVAALADGHRTGGTSQTGANNTGGTLSPIPLGIGEWGNSANGTSPSYADWHAYNQYIISFYQARIAAGKLNGWIIWFNDGGTPAPQPENQVDMAKDTDFLSGAGSGKGYPNSTALGFGRIPDIQAVYDALNGGLPPGMTLSAAGVLGGKPTAGGTFPFGAVVTDAAGNTDVQQLTITVGG